MKRPRVLDDGNAWRRAVTRHARGLEVQARIDETRRREAEQEEARRARMKRELCVILVMGAVSLLALSLAIVELLP